MGNLDRSFTGDYDVVLDESCRLAVPRSIRTILEKNEVVLTKGSAYPCIRLYTCEAFEKRMDEIMQLDPDSADGVEVRRRNIVYRCELDKQGRILIPEKLRVYAGLSKDCMVLGMLDFVEIWDAGRHKSYECGEEKYSEISERFARIKKRKQKESINAGNSAHSSAAAGDNTISRAKGQE